MVHDRIHQRTAVMPRRRMHDHSLGLIHDKDIAVLIKDIQRNILRQDIRQDLLRDGEGDKILLPDL